ncbi:MAG: IS200/IS605 family transposase [Balneola sp.]|nr:MAG: IS200/IS605 family transposase [Balneola sp.]
MSHSKNKVWVHAIWSTKNRMPFISSDIEKKVFDFIKNEFDRLECSLQIINGVPDHIHCLFLLNQNKSLAEVLKQIKGSSSHWINQNDLTSSKFAWQTGYAAYSVSESLIKRVHSYIKNQKQHHLKKTFTQEYEEFIELHKLENG